MFERSSEQYPPGQLVSQMSTKSNFTSATAFHADGTEEETEEGKGFKNVNCKSKKN
jgi:hypothetical protein